MPMTAEVDPEAVRNQAIADIAIRVQTDERYRDVVIRLCKLDRKKLDAVATIAESMQQAAPDRHRLHHLTELRRMRYTRSRTRMGHFASSRLISRMYWIRFIWLLLSVGIPYFTIFVEKRLSNDAKAAKRGLNAKKQGLYGSCFFGFSPYCSLLILFCII